MFQFFFQSGQFLAPVSQSNWFTDKLLPGLIIATISTGITIWIFTYNNRKDKRRRRRERNNLHQLLNVSHKQIQKQLKTQIEKIEETIKEMDETPAFKAVPIVSDLTVEHIQKISVTEIFKSFVPKKSSENDSKNYNRFIQPIYAIPKAISHLVKYNDEFESFMGKKIEQLNLDVQKLVDFFHKYQKDPENADLMTKLSEILNNTGAILSTRGRDLEAIEQTLIEPIKQMLESPQIVSNLKVDLSILTHQCHKTIREMKNTKIRYLDFYRKILVTMNNMQNEFGQVNFN